MYICTGRGLTRDVSLTLEPGRKQSTRLFYLSTSCVLCTAFHFPGDFKLFYHDTWNDLCTILTIYVVHWQGVTRILLTNDTSSSYKGQGDISERNDTIDTGEFCIWSGKWINICTIIALLCLVYAMSVFTICIKLKFLTNKPDLMVQL